MRDSYLKRYHSYSVEPLGQNVDLLAGTRLHEETLRSFKKELEIEKERIRNGAVSPIKIINPPRR